MSKLTQLGTGFIGLVRGPQWGGDQLRQFQLSRLRALVQHACDNVPFYRRLFDRASIEPDDIESLDDLRRIPCTSRAELQEFPPSDFEAQGLKLSRLIAHSTSGSTGEPLTVRQTKSEEMLSKALRLRALFRCGARPWYRMTRIVFCPDEQDIEQRAWKQWFKLQKMVLPRQDIHCLLPTEQVLAKLREAKPDILAGFPSALQRLANILSGSDKKLIRPRMLVTGAEILTPASREIIVEAFQAPLFDLYGAHEAPLIAYECPRGGQYHICEDAVIGEILRDGLPVDEGDVGEMVVTVLHAYAMPIIRYRLGDLVTKGRNGCVCQSPYSTLNDIQGRLIDCFVAPSGAEIHPSSIDQPLRKLAPWIVRYQVVQEAFDTISIRVVTDGSPNVEQLNMVGVQLSQTVGSGVQVKLKCVDGIPLGPAGKFHLYLSNLRSGNPERI